VFKIYAFYEQFALTYEKTILQDKENLFKKL